MVNLPFRNKHSGTLPVNTDSKLMDMLTGYASAHQHPFNIAVHLVGIPIIMLGVFIPLSRVSADILGTAINLANVATFGLFVFYFTLDRIFSILGLRDEPFYEVQRRINELRHEQTA